MKFAGTKISQHVVYLNFMLNSRLCLAFEGSRKLVDDMVINIYWQ